MSGVTLVMESRTAGALRVSNWAEVTLRGLSIEYATLPTNQAVITRIGADGRSFDVSVPVGYPLDDWAAASSSRTRFDDEPMAPRSSLLQPAATTLKTFSCNVYVGSSRFLRVGSGDVYAQTIEALGASRAYRLHFSHDVGPNTQAVQVGDTLGCRNARFAFTVHIDGCSHSRFEGLTLRGGPGFGFFHGRPSGGAEDSNIGNNTFSRLVLTYPDPPAGSTALPVLSSSADAFHIAGVTVGPTIEHSVLEGHHDDGIALHGHYSLVVQSDDGTTQSDDRTARQSQHDSVQSDDRTTRQSQHDSVHSDDRTARHSPHVLSHGSASIVVTDADFGVGHALRLYDTAFHLAATARVTSVTRLPGYVPPHNVSHTMPSVLARAHSFLRLGLQLRTLPPHRPIDWDSIVFNTARGCAGFALRNNTIRNHRARGMLVKADHGVISDNHIENSTLGGIIITPELYWGEGDYVTNLTVTRNVVRNVCIGKQCYGGIALGAKGPGGGFVPGAPYGHRDIRITNNSIENVSQLSLLVTSAQYINMSDNSVVSPYTYTPVATCGPPLPFPKGQVVWMSEAGDVTVAANCIRQPGGLVPPAAWFNVTASVVNSSVAGGFREC
jgi:hypothetical protein